jgi:hypothetical protein
MRLRSLASVTCRRACAALLMFFVGVAPTAAYENDVHWGLTYWLAIKAGFKPEIAFQIAQADQNDDEGDRDAVKLVVKTYEPWSKHDCLSNWVYLLHFPSDKGPPNDPKGRTVSPGNSVARERLLHLHPAQRPCDRPTPQVPELPILLGSALHRFQDSYSHQGEPDPPFMWGFHPYKDLTWGHPQKRGGYRSHDADLTSQHVPKEEPHDQNETVVMARETYEVLKSFLRSKESIVYKAPVAIRSRGKIW